MDDTPNRGKPAAPQPNDDEDALEDRAADAEFIANMEIDDEFLAMLEEGLWSADNEPPVTAEELRKNLDELFAEWRAEDERAARSGKR
jgi:hypothetical protein